MSPYLPGLAEDLTVTFHETGTVARQGRGATNAPEGVHQDGADYIVSALVVERVNVEGGMSLIVDDDTGTVFSVVLEPGQGIFQADRGSSLWHYVTPILLGGEGRDEGVRNIFGFDVAVSAL
jgi:hypothetical protein